MNKTKFYIYFLCLYRIIHNIFVRIFLFFLSNITSAVENHRKYRTKRKITIVNWRRNALILVFNMSVTKISELKI